jgi:hypothetical protein
MAKKAAERGRIFDGSRIRKLNLAKLAKIAGIAAEAYAEAQEGGLSPAKIAAALARWQEARAALDGAIVKAEQLRIDNNG